MGKSASQDPEQELKEHTFGIGDLVTEEEAE